MKLLLDQGLPRSTVEILRRSGIDAVHVGDIGHAESNDDVILALARTNHRIVVTLDADFHARLALSGNNSPSVIRIRIEGLRGEQLAELLQKVFDQCSAELTSGAVVTVQPSRIRVRLLPLKTSTQDSATSE